MNRKRAPAAKRKLPTPTDTLQKGASRIPGDRVSPLPGRLGQDAQSERSPEEKHHAAEADNEAARLRVEMAPMNRALAEKYVATRYPGTPVRLCALIAALAHGQRPSIAEAVRGGLVEGRFWTLAELKESDPELYARGTDKQLSQELSRGKKKLGLRKP